MCRDALTKSNGKLDQAFQIVSERIAREFSSQTGATIQESKTYLQSTEFDLELALKRWRHDNPGPEPTPREKLQNGCELAAELPYSDILHRVRYAHIIPTENGYELRLFTHDAKYTEEIFGLDYDYAMQDANTRVKREFITDLESAMNQLSEWGCLPEMLQSPSFVNSCLVNSPLDAYLELPHLQINDESNTA